MGQKVNPKSYRLATNHNWNSMWFTGDKNKYRQQLRDDILIREFVNKNYNPQAAIADINIERTVDRTKMIINSGRPGVVIGRSGQGVEKLTQDIKRLVSGKVDVEVVEIKKPDLNAYLVAQNIGQQISRRVSYRKAVKMTMQKVMQSGASGIKVTISGRLNGAEIARNEKFTDGKIPLSTIRSYIDYAVYHSITTFGTIGVKVWIYIGRI